MNERRHPPPASRRRHFRQNWKTWVAALLMLAGIAIYVLTLDDSVEVRNEDAADAPQAPGSQAP